MPILEGLLDTGLTSPVIASPATSHIPEASSVHEGIMFQPPMASAALPAPERNLARMSETAFVPSSLLVHEGMVYQPSMASAPMPASKRKLTQTL